MCYDMTMQIKNKEGRIRFQSVLLLQELQILKAKERLPSMEAVVQFLMDNYKK